MKLTIEDTLVDSLLDSKDESQAIVFLLEEKIRKCFSFVFVTDRKKASAEYDARSHKPTPSVLLIIK